MSKNTKRALFILSGILIVTCIGIFFRTEFLVAPEKLAPDDALVRNITWNSQVLDNIPYKQGDNLEFTYIFTKPGENLGNIDLSKLKEFVDISDIQIDSRSGSSDISNIPFTDNFSLKVIGKAKKPSDDSSAIKNLVDVNIIPKKEIPAKVEDATGAIVIAKPIVNIGQTRFYSHMNNVLILSGQNLSSIDKVIIGEKSFSGISKDGKYYIQIDKNTFDSGDYFVGLYLKNGELVPLEQKLSFIFDASPINIIAITPSKISAKNDTYIVIQGNGFSKLVSLQLSNNVIFKTPAFQVITDQAISVKIPAGLPIGTYSFNLMDTKGIYESKNQILTVTQ